MHEQPIFYPFRDIIKLHFLSCRVMTGLARLMAKKRIPPHDCSDSSLTKQFMC
jgi:hypothetical protein